MRKWIWTAVAAVFVMVALFATRPAIGPSTEYLNPKIGTDEPCGPPNDVRSCVYLGDEFYVNIGVIRHDIEANCRFEVTRYAEEVGGPRHGRRLPISRQTLEFVGQGERRRVRWPQPPDKYILGYAIDDHGRPNLDEPLLLPGVDEQRFRFFVVGRYYCHPLDWVFPRYIQGGDRPNETAPVEAIVRRRKP